MRTGPTTLLMIGLAIAVAPAVGQVAAGKPTRATEFRKLDRNNDGKLSPAEVKGNASLRTSFEMLDQDHDGFLSSDEYGVWNGAGKPVATRVDGTTGPGGSSGAQHMPRE